MEEAVNEDEVTILTPEHSIGDVHALLHLLGGQWVKEKTVDLSSLEGLLADVGFRWMGGKSLKEKEAWSLDQDDYLETYSGAAESSDENIAVTADAFKKSGIRKRKRRPPKLSYKERKSLLNNNVRKEVAVFIEKEIQEAADAVMRDQLEFDGDRVMSEECEDYGESTSSDENDLTVTANAFKKSGNKKRKKRPWKLLSKDRKSLSDNNVRKEVAVFIEKEIQEAADAVMRDQLEFDRDRIMSEECEDYGESTSDEELKPEKKRNRLSQRKQLACEQCPTKLSDLDSLLTHVKAHVVIDPSSQEPDWFGCPEVDCTFSHPKELGIKTHLKFSHQKTWCVYCARLLYTTTLTQHMKTNHANLPQRMCQECSQPFGSKRSLRKHVVQAHKDGIQVKLEEDPKRPGHEKCPTVGCDVYERERDDLCKHHLEDHGKAKCPYCLQDFVGQTPEVSLKVSVEQLQKHLQRGHKKFLCTICYKVCPSGKSLGSHKKSHKSSKLVCHLCAGEYTSSSLRSHVKVCNGTLKRMKVEYYSDGEDVFKRTEHPMADKLKRKLDISQPLSTPLPCPEEGCNFMGSTRVRLLNHLNQQHNPQECPHCKKMFSYATVTDHVGKLMHFPTLYY